MESHDWPDWLPFDWSVNIRKIDSRTLKCYIHPDGHKCYSKPEVLAYLKKINRSTPNAKTQNANGSTVDLPVDVDAPQTNDISESLPGERPTKLTPRTSRRKSHTRDLSEEALAGVGSSSVPLPSRSRKGDSNWLPGGWTQEVKLRKSGSTSGMRYRIYTDPISGQKFFSKPQVLKHLAQTNTSAGGQKEETTLPSSASAGGQKEETTIPISASLIWQEKSTTEPDNTQPHEATEVKKNRTGKKTESIRMSSDYDVISRTPVEGLPAGWIKEVRVKKHGATKRQDSYYLDPLSEYAFLSKKDALRYLESGDIRRCVMKPIRRDVNNDTGNVDLTSSREELTSADPSKGIETPKELPNGSVEQLKTNESDIQNPKPVRSISGGSFSLPNEENPVWLPDGWVSEVHYKKSGTKYKIFKEVASGKKLLSKPQVLNYLAGGSSSIPNEENLDWLPDGWVTEVHNKKSGTKYKIFKEVASGKKLFSKPQVLNYLAGGSSSNSRKRDPDSSPNPTPADVTRSKRSRKKKGDIQSSDCQEVITTSPADGLPPGWIKEIRTKIYATHKRNDPFYTDPVSGYIFRSKLDAMRYLETGDVNLCAMRPKVKDKDGKEVYVYTDDGQKPVKPTKGRRLFDKEDDDLLTENHEENQITTDPKTANSTKRKASIRNTKHNNSATSSAARSSKRQKGASPGTDPKSAGAATGGNGAVQQATWVDLEKQPADDGNLSYDIPEDENWSIDFAVKSLTDEILFNGGETAGVNETPTKVN